MSRRLASLVYSRKVGGIAAKALLAFCAEKANDKGMEVWASKVTMAAALDCGKSTVLRAMQDLVGQGLLVPTGTRRCSTGSTIVYRLDVAAIEALPLARPDAEADADKGCQIETGSNPTPVPERHPGGVNLTPKPSLNRPLDRGEEMPGPTADDIQAAFDAFNAFAVENGWWKRALKLNKARSAALRNRLKDADGLDGWKAALVRAEASDFLMGRTSQGFQPGLDFFCQESSFLKLMEGTYDNRSGVRGSRGNVAVFPTPRRGGSGGGLAGAALRAILDDQA